MAEAKKNDDFAEEAGGAGDDAEETGDMSVAGDAGDTGDEDAGIDALEAVKAERDAFRDRFLRALAEAENMRKRAEKDRREAEHYGGSKLSRDILPVYDNLTRALEAVTDKQRQANKALVEGVDLTRRELLNVFARHGIERISPEVGDVFDPLVHEAMFEAPMPDTVAGEIIQVSAEGFRLRDRLLRPARVGVSSTPKTPKG